MAHKLPSILVYKVYRQEAPVFVGCYNGEDIYRAELTELGYIDAIPSEAMNIAKLVYKIAAPVLEVRNV